MKHTRASVPEYTDVYLFFHNTIEITATRKTESKRSDIRAYLPMEQARRIQATLNFMDKFNLASPGHAAWHIDNNKPEKCEYCRSE